METIVERPGALDVHKEQVTACVRVPIEGPFRSTGAPTPPVVQLIEVKPLKSTEVPWAFRGDIDHMDCLKSLPVAPLALAPSTYWRRYQP